MSEIRKRYTIRLICRCLILVVCLIASFVSPNLFGALEHNAFFDRFTVVHLLWIVWVIDMIQQIIPIKNKVALGSQKLFLNRFKPIRDRINHDALRDYVVSTTKAAYRVMLLWCALLIVVAIAYYKGTIGRIGLFIISVTFYVCDLICVLIWCPFRLMMNTRCCTTCRIFNWDHFMMFSPLAFMGGFFALSLFVIAVIALLVWEFCILIHPERFWDRSNAALKCSECTDKLCTQYCQKLKSK